MVSGHHISLFTTENNACLKASCLCGCDYVLCVYAFLHGVLECVWVGGYAGVNAHDMCVCVRTRTCRGPKSTLSIFIHSLLDGGLSSRSWTLLTPASLVRQLVLGIARLYLLSVMAQGDR